MPKKIRIKREMESRMVVEGIVVLGRDLQVVAHRFLMVIVIGMQEFTRVWPHHEVPSW